MHKKKSPRIYTSMHSGRFELTKLTYIVYTRLEDNLIRDRGDRGLCTLPMSNPFWPCLLHAIVQNPHLLVALQDFSCISASIIIIILILCYFPYCPILFSFGLLAFPILELQYTTNRLDYTSPCLLYFCRPTAISPNFFCVSFTILTLRRWGHADVS